MNRSSGPCSQGPLRERPGESDCHGCPPVHPHPSFSTQRRKAEKTTLAAMRVRIRPPHGFGLRQQQRCSPPASLTTVLASLIEGFTERFG